jgi:predicted acylesterase/phospholipase RssA
VPETLPSGGKASKKLERARKQPLTSPALGTSASDLVEPCAVGDPYPADPPAAAGMPFALAFSGGGFRASLAALGVLRFVADAGLLGRVRYVSSVSGGSVAHGAFASHPSWLRVHSLARATSLSLRADPRLDRRVRSRPEGETPARDSPCAVLPFSGRAPSSHP